MLVLVVLPIAEIYVVVQVSHAIGVLDALGLLIGVSLVGAWLVKRQGLRVWTRFNRQAARGEVPTKAMADGALLLVAGALLLIPGFITDGLGILLLVPPVRAVVRAVMLRRARGHSTIVATYSGSLSTDRVIDVGSDDDD